MIKASAESKVQRKINRAYFDGLAQGHKEGIEAVSSILRTKGIGIVPGENGRTWLHIRGGQHPMAAAQK
jgi:hypothetical protein